MKTFQPKLIMIDLDGTLVDSVPDLAYCIDEMMQRVELKQFDVSQFSKLLYHLIY